MKTYNVTKKDIKKEWYIVDAKDKVLGRLASKVASILKGKAKPIYTPYLDTGDNVIIINAKYVKLTGKKISDKKYYRYSGYPGGLKIRTASEYLKKSPCFLILHAIKGMLPKNRLGRKLLKNVRIYSEATHPHISQNPIKLEI